MGRLAITKATTHKTESGAAEITGGHTVFFFPSLRFWAPKPAAGMQKFFMPTI